MGRRAASCRRLDTEVRADRRAACEGASAVSGGGGGARPGHRARKQGGGESLPEARISRCRGHELTVVEEMQTVNPNTVAWSSKTKVYKLPKRPHLQHSRYLRLQSRFCHSV